MSKKKAKRRSAQLREKVIRINGKSYPSPILYPSYRMGKAPANKGMTLTPEPLNREEIDALLKVVGRGPCGVRNRALIVTLWRCGLRINEALELYPRDIEIRDGTVNVRRGKGAKWRKVGIDPQALAVIELWLELRTKRGFTGSHPVFCTIAKPRPGRKMHDSYVRDMLKKRARQAGIEKRVHPHGLRHTHAFELMMENKPLIVIQKQLGHSNLATTARYVDHLAPTQVIEAMRGRTWDETAEGAAAAAKVTHEGAS